MNKEEENLISMTSYISYVTRKWGKAYTFETNLFIEFLTLTTRCILLYYPWRERERERANEKMSIQINAVW
jgi:hypothetical protein